MATVLLTRLLPAVGLGTLLMFLHHLGVIAGLLTPPAGFTSLGYLRNLDIPQYLTWIALASDSLLVPNYNAPWLTEPALFQPLMVLIARLPLPLPLAYYGVHLLFYWVAAFCLLAAADTFCFSRRQKILALVVLLCEVPLKMLGWAVGKLVAPLLAAAFSYGLVEFSYDSADGLFRGGASNSVTLTFGTATMIGGFVLLTKYLESGAGKYLIGLLAVCTVSAIVHPYEIFVLAPGSVVALLLYRHWRAAAAVGAAAALGMAPHFYLLLRSPWLLDNAESIHGTVNPLVWAPSTYGIPMLALAGLMALRFQMKAQSDQVLQIWLLTTLLMPFVPGTPFAMHLFDGFAYCLALLLMRVLVADKKLRILWDERPKLARPLAIGICALPILSMVLLLVQLAKDGRAAEPEYLLSSVLPSGDVQVLDWVSANVKESELVMAPESLAPWVAARKRHSLGSHDIMSITFDEQTKMVNAFYAGKVGLGEVVKRYGVRWVLVPAGAAVQGGEHVAVVGGYRILRTTAVDLMPYPGLAQLKPELQHSHLKQIILRGAESVCRTFGLL